MSVPILYRVGGSQNRKRGETMRAYGYEITGDPDVLKDISENLKDKNSRINWFNFNTGDVYWTADDEQYEVKIDHKLKHVQLLRW